LNLSHSILPAVGESASEGGDLVTSKRSMSGKEANMPCATSSPFGCLLHDPSSTRASNHAQVLQCGPRSGLTDNAASFPKDSNSK